MKHANELRTLLRSIDHKGYPAYKSLAGSYQFPEYMLSIDHVQGDPFASPSSLHVEIDHRNAGFPASYYDRSYVRIALQDYLTRRVEEQFSTYNFKAKGSGKSGLLAITRCGQEVLDRSACQITGDKLIIRFHVGFPAFGRTINAGELDKILFEFLPRCIENGCFYRRQDTKRLKAAIDLAEDQETIREYLHENDLVAFVANGAILPRKSGVSDLPMRDSVPFVSPLSMEITLNLPHIGRLRGMGIRKGITLIVGGGYHGKSTLLEALQIGVYNHIIGDGREYVITDDTAIKLRAEDGRSIRQVDISLFIRDLPNRKDTTCFSTEDASGSTSQAAGVIEGIEAETKLFLIDEDTSATNFMVRDEFMQQVVSRSKEPITPFLERARDLYEKAGVSTILVAGSSGAFFYIADTILQMDCYRPVDITEQVKKLCLNHTAPRITAPDFTLPDFERVLSVPCKGNTIPAGNSYVEKHDRHHETDDNQSNDHRHDRKKIKTFGTDSFSIDKQTVDMRYVEQLADSEQMSALAYLLRYTIGKESGGQRTVRDTIRRVYNILETKGWEPFCSGYVPCGLAMPRIQEFYACLNRYRG